ncbi:AbrB family transcriptional regulator [Lentilactobacillus sp. IMAU92037]|uniref:type II toxin-antitoxin system PemI/MazE family antitoxin n=1 Tax=Lentilactobacillus TaxID=2767893 RepID=UPI001C2785EE|nr:MULTISPECIES: AbrB family transcriptional regulator [Lentilactobacillus]MBU9789444.1 AbrB family transcriptional regulator [Lentilactobacillus dabitei]MBV0930714.1 AbrB family transcriptional regulator [Lentilactobacillus dabitei]MDM7516461.1 AbrB family transcriptional regulator [Lentilactobacillus sp. TOM.63]
MKVHKQGNSLVVTVPKKFGIKPGTEVIAVKGRNGSFYYVPKMSNPFDDHKFPHINEKFSDSLTGREKI